MTPKTQSVCKHCRKEIKPCWLGHVSNFCLGWLHDSNYHDCEDGLHKAEPASTGEPPPSERTITLTALWHLLFPEGTHSADFINNDVGEWLDAYTEEVERYAKRVAAARPSEPSAPQTSAEPSCLICGEIEDNYRHSIELANPYNYHKFKPVPQPVSGDAPKVEEIKADTLFGVYCSANPESIPKDRTIYWEGWQRVADYLNRLRSYFPPASTVRKSPDSHLGAVRD